MTKQMLSICLAFVLLLGTLAGCSKNKTKTDNSSQNTQQETIPELASQYAYQPQYFDLPEPIQWISRSCVSGSTLYFTASILSGQDTYIDEDGNEVSYDTYSEGLFRFDPDSGECVQIVNYVDKPDVEDLDDGTQIFRSSNSSTEIHALAAGTDGTLWIYRRTDLYTDDGEMGPSLSELIQLDAHGTLLRTIIPANEEDPNSTGAIRTLTPCSPMIRAMSIPTIIRQSMFTGRMAASFSANPLTSFPAISASSLPVKSAH